ncbi:MAG TPA: bifunctional DNA primase/polymerase, partial [Actinoplanes sp.]|nr:bifunctional DNA primase/polymerase [Actinoplanes sp.]
MLLTAALAYARHGIPVLPVHTPAADGGCSCGRAGCDRPGKHPRLRHGLTDASTDPRRIEMWWSRWPDANVGVRTGVIMDVADIDSVEGWHGLRRLLGGAMPAGPQARSGGGGWHFWFRPTGYGNRVRLLPGVDWRGTGGYVVAPPSKHANGPGYTWIRRPGLHLPGSPPMLHELIAGPGIFHDDRPIAHPDRYAAAALAAGAERVVRAPVGT